MPIFQIGKLRLHEERFTCPESLWAVWLKHKPRCSNYSCLSVKILFLYGSASSGHWFRSFVNPIPPFSNWLYVSSHWLLHSTMWNKLLVSLSIVLCTLFLCVSPGTWHYSAWMRVSVHFDWMTEKPEDRISAKRVFWSSSIPSFSLRADRHWSDYCPQ